MSLLFDSRDQNSMADLCKTKQAGTLVMQHDIYLQKVQIMRAFKVTNYRSFRHGGPSLTH